jgi:tetratricopeptide (TPR) repeat protein
MRAVNHGILKIWQAWRNQGRIRGGVGILLAISFLALPMSPLAANTAVHELSEKDAVLRAARGLIDQGHNNPMKLRQAITLLEGYKPQFPPEIKFPLYLAEAYYRLADPKAEVSREFPYYEKSDTYAREVLAMDPNGAPGHYWHGLVLLKEAQKRGISGYFLVKEGIRELEKVRRDQPAYDHAGASRVLGLLYCLAPSWTPFGNLNKSIELGQESTRLAPDYALNRLYLANAYKKKGNKAAAMREYQAILTAAANMPGSQAQGLSNEARTMLRALGEPI